MSSSVLDTQQDTFNGEIHVLQLWEISCVISLLLSSPPFFLVLSGIPLGLFFFNFWFDSTFLFFISLSFCSSSRNVLKFIFQPTYWFPPHVIFLIPQRFLFFEYSVLKEHFKTVFASHHSGTINYRVCFFLSLSLFCCLDCLFFLSFLLFVLLRYLRFRYRLPVRLFLTFCLYFRMEPYKVNWKLLYGKSLWLEDFLQGDGVGIGTFHWRASIVSFIRAFLLSWSTFPEVNSPVSCLGWVIILATDILRPKRGSKAKCLIVQSQSLTWSLFWVQCLNNPPLCARCFQVQIPWRLLSAVVSSSIIFILMCFYFSNPL